MTKRPSHAQKNRDQKEKKPAESAEETPLTKKEASEQGKETELAPPKKRQWIMLASLVTLAVWIAFLIVLAKIS